MLRFSSLSYVPTETRRILRDRFARYLPVHRSQHMPAQKQVMLAEASLLNLLPRLRIDFESDLERARATYRASCTEGSHEPSLDELIEAGWIRVVWGRISTTFELARAAQGTMNALAVLLAKRSNETYQIDSKGSGHSDLDDVIAAIERGELAPRNIGCAAPGFVAARLWDHALTDGTNPSQALREWVDRWHLLDSPSLVPTRDWSEVVIAAFRDAAIDALVSEPGLACWQKTRERFIKQVSLVRGQTQEEVDAYIQRIPDTVIDRVLWVCDHRQERLMYGALDGSGNLLSLINPLLADVEAADFAPAPHKTAEQLFSLAIERPELLMLVLLKVRHNPTLLADLLLYPPMSAVACLVVAQWQPSSGAWDRELTARDDQLTKSIAFADAVSVMGHFLGKDELGPGEPAALLNWLHMTAQRGFIDDLAGSEAILAALRAEIAGQPTRTISGMFDALLQKMPERGLGSSVFAAALDLVDIGRLAGEIDPSPLLNAYTHAIREGHYDLSAHRVGIQGAASLLELASRSPESRQKFLYPINIRERLADGVASEEDPSPYIARSLRAHIRILCRAIAGSSESAPVDVLDALVAAIRAGAQAHKEKGRVAAFSPHHETAAFGGPLDRPIAADLGETLGALAGEARDHLLAAILETDEPMVLAQLLSLAPRAVRSSIEKRITGLTPPEAGQVYRLTDVQARIEEMLTAGAADAAAQFMAVEQELKTWGPVPGRELVRLRAVLRLQFLRGEWDDILHTQPPHHLNPIDRESASDTIGFYKALATLKKPGGDLEAAENLFAQLKNRRPDVPAYAINLFATRVSILLRGDLFMQLHGADAHRARQVLGEAEQMIGRLRELAPSDAEGVTFNKALLLLALGQPQQAFELLTPLRANRSRDNVAAYTAVALSRMDRVADALAVLKAAEETFGSTEVLRAARAHIGHGTPFPSVATLSSDNDRLVNVKLAFSDLRQMDPIKQASVLQTQGESFADLVIEHVRSAASNIISLVPMMKGGAERPHEDNITALICRMLQSRVHFLGWSLPDQSQGG